MPPCKKTQPLAVFNPVLGTAGLRYGQDSMSNPVRLACQTLACVALLATAADRASGQDANHEAAVARTVRSLAEFTRWPRPGSALELCVAGPASHAGQLDGVRLSDGRVIRRRAVAASPAGIAGCELLYIGRLPLTGQRELVAAVRGRGVMTVAEADAECRSGAMFCLTYPARGISFRLNVDAVSRSGLRVDPRVLRVAEGGR